ncbi:AfsR/SARP family transcriptional regulator [Kitasatospora sp. NPDC048538]|uniref:AfsR/SARP family transcriptional regulator n=1 Tax=unclassified Kitasatospora TaxID=2633591 RepID=UPI00340094C8
MRIRLLGPVELRAGTDGFVSLPGAQRRAILALLALRLGRVVGVDGFSELLWGDRPPASARAALQGHVAALRKALAGTPFVLHTRSPGYLLDGPADEVDALLFESLTGRAGERAGRGSRAADAEAIALLEQALRLWRGEALADLPDTALRSAAVDQLDQAHSAAVLSWAGLRLRQGSGAAAVPALEQNVRADGLREEMVALLMRCLHQAGRPADALAAYHRARRRLDRELGLRPGPALEAALAEVLSGDRAQDADPAGTATLTAPVSPAGPAVPAAVPRVPRQLPRRPLDVVGRGAEAGWLDRECGPERSGDGLALVVGPAGSGKTTLVASWAHGRAADFPDGQLFADLQGLDPEGPVDPDTALDRFLQALGVAREAVPADRDGRAALYRDRTRGRRLLVVLDDAADADQVADLLPEGPGCATVVTSRGSLEGLVSADGAALLRLEALPEADALRLLEGALGTERLRAEPAAAAELAALCDHLPLALRIAAARLATRPDWTIAELAAELADEGTRLSVLDADGATGVATELRRTFRRLSPTAAELLTLLAVHPGREVDALAGAALLGADAVAARRALGELTAHHLLTGTAPGRYGRTELVRLFSAGLLAEQPEECRRLAWERLVDYYHAALRHCGAYLDPGQEDDDAPVLPLHALPPATDIRTALDWFRAEEPAIRALIDTADSTAPDRAWRLALTCGSLYYGASRFTDWLRCARVGEAAAERCGDPVASALLHVSRAQALVALERRHEAAEVVRKAVDATRSMAGPVAVSARVRALATLGLVTAMTGSAAEADRLAASATALALEAGDRRRLVDALVHQGWVNLAGGDREGAQRRSREARQLLPAVPVTQVHIWSMLTEAQSLPPTVHDQEVDLAWHRLLAACEEAGLLYLHAIAEQSYAGLLLARGREREGTKRLRLALDRFDRHDRLAGFVSEFTGGLEESLKLRSSRSF